MLAQNFRTAVDQGVDQFELDALAMVLSALERGEILYAPAGDILGRKPHGKYFNLALGFSGVSDDYCGSVGCIAGWANALSGRRAFTEFQTRQGDKWLAMSDRLPRAVMDLFFGSGGTGCNSQVTTDHAAAALRNYLTLGEPRWAEVLAE